MKQALRPVAFETRADIEFVDLTPRVREEVRSAGVREGTVTVVTRHTTGGVAVNELDPALQRDMVAWLRKSFPAGAGYEHDRAPIDDRVNAHAHLAGLVLRASETLLVRNGDLDLGPWQSVFFVECDGPRSRQVALVIRGTE